VRKNLQPTKRSIVHGGIANLKPTPGPAVQSIQFYATGKDYAAGSWGSGVESIPA